MARPQVADRGTASNKECSAKKFNKQSLTADEVWSSSLGLGEGLTTPPCKTALFRNTHVQVASSADKIIRRQNTPKFGSPGGVSRGGISQNTKGDEIRHMER